MKIKRFICVIMSVILGFSLCVGISATDYDHNTPEPTMTGFVPSDDGTPIEYAVYGSPDAEPIVLMSPNNGSMHAFDWELVPELSKRFMVITFSTRGTGNTPLSDKKLTFEQDCIDLDAVLDELKINDFNVYGFSDGGNLGLVYTLKNPERVRRLAIKGANLNTRGVKLITQLKTDWRFIRLSIDYFFTKDPVSLRRRNITGKMVGQPNMTYKDLESITCPVLNIYGEHDISYRSHSKKITQHINGAEELMIKGSGHTCSEQEVNEVLLPAVLDFFGDGK
ncbi:MAG: alpha/beta hydrolase [Clostridia bacterium]|nr:alpha/beta hydrolase [Clostridia bacterium]